LNGTDEMLPPFVEAAGASASVAASGKMALRRRFVRGESMFIRKIQTPTGKSQRLKRLAGPWQDSAAGDGASRAVLRNINFLMTLTLILGLQKKPILLSM
jgi:hypothetical protein